MDLSETDRRLIGRLNGGLPLVPAPYAALAAELGLAEANLLDQVARWQADGTINRFGVIVDHRALGFTANAMVVWDLPDDAVDEIGRRFGGMKGVGLCYRRPRRPPDWPYNLFTMIHGRDVAEVRARVSDLAAASGLKAPRHQLLFTTARFKQSAACYGVHRGADERRLVE